MSEEPQRKYQRTLNPILQQEANPPQKKAGNPRKAVYTNSTMVNFTDEQMKQIQIEAEKKGLPVAVFIRTVVLEHINQKS